VPTGTIVDAAGGTNVQFITTAEAVFRKNTTCASNPLPDPVQAVTAGENGNVPAGAITVIPTSSLEQIARSNNTTSNQLKLTVINSDDITGGGMSQVAAITTNDLTHAKQDLHQQLQSQINAWLKSLPQDGILGKTITTDTLINTPGTGAAIDSGNSFQATVKVSASVLFVSNSNLKANVLPQLDSTLHTDKNYADYALLTGTQQPALTIRNLKIQNSSATALKATFTATAEAINAIYATHTDQIKNIVAGKTPTDATHLIEGQLPGVRNVKVTTTPSFIASIDPWITFWQSHISVNVVPDTTSISK
jgi:hypothetical protein